MNNYNKFNFFLPATNSYLEAVGDPYLSHHSYVEHAVAREISQKLGTFLFQPYITQGALGESTTSRSFLGRRLQPSPGGKCPWGS